MTRPNGKDREFPTTPSEHGAPSKVPRLPEDFDDTELAGTELDPWREHFEQSISDVRDIDGELLEGRMLVELFGGEPPEVAIGQYLIEQRLGRGGMGEVYAGRDILAGHEVAIKLLRPTDDLELDRKRLIHEARALAKVKHPNVITLHHIGEHEGRLFIVMERVLGQTLAQWQGEGPATPSLRALLRVYAAAARGLAAAHRAGVVHGDFKPSNVLLGSDGRVLVSDFGVASVHDELVDEDGSNRGGTLLYLAPERAAGEDGDFRSDQFSFFSALFQAVHGVGPVPGSTREELLHNLCEGRLVLTPKRGRRIPSWLKRAFERGLAQDPRRRFASMDEVAALLERRSSRVQLYVGASLGAAALLVGLGWAFASRDPLADVWSAEDRRVIAANDATEPVIPEIDKWAARWRTVHGEWSQLPETGRCLLHARDRLEMLVDRLVGAEVSSKVAFLAVEGLPDPIACVGDRAAPPEQLSEHEQAEIATALAQAEFARLELRSDEAIRLAEHALAQAERVQWLGARLDALEQIGLALRDKQMRVDAVETLDAARRLAMQSGSFERAAELAVAVALALNDEIPEPQRELMVDLALVLVDGVDSASARMLAQLALAQANEQLRLNDPAAAELTLARALAQLDEDSVPPYLQLQLYRRIADAIGEQGRARTADAERAYQRALEFAEHRLGDHHDAVEMTKLFNNFGVTLSLDGRHEEAKAWHHRALARQAEVLPEDHALVADTLVYLGHLEAADRNYPGALDYSQRALRILSEPGLNQVSLRHAHELESVAYEGLGNVWAALEACDRAIAALPKPALDLTIQRAMYLSKLGHGDEAIAIYQADLLAFESELKSADEFTAMIDAWIAWLELLNQQKKPDLADREFERIRAKYDITETDLERLERAARADHANHVGESHQ